MLLKFYHHLHPLFEVESSFVDKNYEDTSLDIFEMVVSTSEPSTELVIQEFFYISKILGECKRHQMLFRMVGGGMNSCSQLLTF
jgi:hypothetical protein